jgi:hypothetical protein
MVHIRYGGMFIAYLQWFIGYRYQTEPLKKILVQLDCCYFCSVRTQQQLHFV